MLAATSKGLCKQQPQSNKSIFGKVEVSNYMFTREDMEYNNILVGMVL
jgi:hypothetical protein